MQDLSHSQVPPGGWIFYQPQSQWSMPSPVSQTFTQAVQHIIKHRMANPAMVMKHGLKTDQASVEQELDTYTRLRLKIPMASPPKMNPRLQSLSQVAGAVADVKRAAQGTGVIIDWLTSGGQPVEQAEADRRAEICVKCPKNVPGSWYTVAPAEIIRETLSARSDLKLETPYDNELKSCDVCKCLMRLKVFTPLHFIKDRTAPEIMAEFPSNCWITK